MLHLQMVRPYILRLVPGSVRKSIQPGERLRSIDLPNSDVFPGTDLRDKLREKDVESLQLAKALTDH